MAQLTVNEIEYDGVQCNEVYNDGNDYYFCTYSDSSVLFKSEEPVKGRTKTKKNIFAYDTLQEIDNRILELELIQ